MSTTPGQFTLVSAATGDRVPGVEISDPESPISWEHLPPDAQGWAEAQGYGSDDAELLYVLRDGEQAPAGSVSYQVSLP